MNLLHGQSSAPLRARNLIGASVINCQSEFLGNIIDLVIDPKSAMVSYAVVSFGGFFGVGEKLFAIPFSALKYDAVEDEYMLDIAKDRLEVAPGFNSDNWPLAADEQWNRNVHQSHAHIPARN